MYWSIQQLHLNSLPIQINCCYQFITQCADLMWQTSGKLECSLIQINSIIFRCAQWVIYLL